MPNYTVRFYFCAWQISQPWEFIVIGGHVRSTWSVSVTQVCLWFGAFGNGRTAFEGKQRPVWHSGFQCACLPDGVATQDRCVQVNDLARVLDISLCSCAQYVHCPRPAGLQKSVNPGFTSQIITKLVVWDFFLIHFDTLRRTTRVFSVVHCYRVGSVTWHRKRKKHPRTGNTHHVPTPYPRQKNSKQRLQ